MTRQARAALLNLALSFSWVGIRPCRAPPRRRCPVHSELSAVHGGLQARRNPVHRHVRACSCLPIRTCSSRSCVAVNSLGLPGCVFDRRGSCVVGESSLRAANHRADSGVKVRSEDGFVHRTLEETHVTASSTSADLFRSLVVIECGPKNPNSFGHAFELSGPATRLSTVCWTKSEGMDQPTRRGEIKEDQYASLASTCCYVSPASLPTARSLRRLPSLAPLRARSRDSEAWKLLAGSLRSSRGFVPALRSPVATAGLGSTFSRRLDLGIVLLNGLGMLGGNDGIGSDGGLSLADRLLFSPVHEKVGVQTHGVNSPGRNAAGQPCYLQSWS